MKQLSLLLLLCLASFTTVLGQKKFNYSKDFKSILTKSKDPKSNLYYETLLNRFKSDDTTMTRPEILALLIGFTAKPDYKPYNVLTTERLIYKLNDEEKYQEAHDTALILLKKYPLSFQALKEMAYASEKLEKPDSAAYYMNLVAKIMSAMIYSGDGRSPETAMFALGPADGQHLLRMAGIGIGRMGSGKDKNGNFLDMLTAISKGKETQMYFNIQHAVAKMFDGKSTEEMMEELGLGEEKKTKKKKKNK